MRLTLILTTIAVLTIAAVSMYVLPESRERQEQVPPHAIDQSGEN